MYKKGPNIITQDTLGISVKPNARAIQNTER